MQGAAPGQGRSAVGRAQAQACVSGPNSPPHTPHPAQGPRFPSATAALRAGLADVPLAAVGGGWASDCAPADANYSKFYAATSAPAWQVVLAGAGHFQASSE